MKPLMLILSLLPLSAAAQSHTAHNMPAATASESGQAGFAALAEIVALLQSDPATDWTRVDIAALRAHLLDMDRLMTNLEVTTQPLPDGIAVSIARDALGADASLRMVPAHSGFLASETGWHSAVSMTETALLWTVTDPDDAARIIGLGFFGLMATGNHHPRHHLALATGQPPH